MTISVIIPTCNGAEFIRDALESVYSQTISPREIIVVDDASTDNTLDLVRDLAPSAPLPIRVISLEKNHGGPAGPLNVGISAAAGELIAVLDQDDVFLGQKLEQQSRVLVEQPEVSIVAGICAPFPGNDHDYVPVPLLEEIQRRARTSSPSAGGSCSPTAQILSGPDALHILIGHGNFVMGFPGFMFRKADWVARGGLDTSFKVAADLDFACWLCTRGDLAFIPRPHYLRREHESNICRDCFAVNWEFQKVCLRYRSHALDINCHCGLDRKLRDLVFRSAWDLKDRNDYATAAQTLLQGFSHWPHDWRMSTGLIKLPLHWCRSLLIDSHSSAEANPA
jgi:glycosyltransferase involved in cell wall biosynthesis